MRAHAVIGLVLALGAAGCERGGTDAEAPAAGTAPATNAGGMAGHGGMAAQDPDPSRNFAKQMIEHHQGAIDMSQAAVQGPLDPEMKALAEKIVGDQEREIAQMQAFLRRTEEAGGTAAPAG